MDFNDLYTSQQTTVCAACLSARKQGGAGMKVNVIVTIHSIEVLSAERLGELTMLLTVTFGAGVAINTDKHVAEVRLVTADISTLFRTVENLIVRLARQYSEKLWVSVGTDWKDEEQ